jgi:hypothetical protein
MSFATMKWYAFSGQSVKKRAFGEPADAPRGASVGRGPDRPGPQRGTAFSEKA